MTTAHVEKFVELVGTDPALLAKLGEFPSPEAVKAALIADAFITNALKEAKAQGLQFDKEEAWAFVHAYMDTANKGATSGELSELQLEAVAGGKGGSASSKAGSVFNLWKKYTPVGIVANKTGLLGKIGL